MYKRQLQIYPEIRNIAAPRLHSSVTPSSPSEPWHGYLISLMGSGSTLIVAYIGVVFLYALKPKGLKRFALILVSLFSLDIMQYTVRPMLRTDRWIGYCGSYPEPFMAASQLGVPEWLFYIFAVASFLGSCCLVAFYIIRHTGEDRIQNLTTENTEKRDREEVIGFGFNDSDCPPRT